MGEPGNRCCPEGFDEACDGVCSDSETDRQHCGSCHISCGADQNCQAGQCVAACPPQNPEACPGPNGSVTCHSACPAGTQCCTGSCLSACPGGQRRDPDRGCGCVAV